MGDSKQNKIRKRRSKQEAKCHHRRKWFEASRVFFSAAGLAPCLNISAVFFSSTIDLVFCCFFFFVLFSDQCFWSHRLLFCTSYSLRASYQIKFFNFIFFFPFFHFDSRSCPAAKKFYFKAGSPRRQTQKEEKRERERWMFDVSSSIISPAVSLSSPFSSSSYLSLFFFYLIYIHMCSFSHFLNVEELWKEISLS